MHDTVIQVEDLSKQYYVGEVSSGTISHDLNRWWCRVRGRPDPTLKVTETNVRDHKSDSEYVWALRDINFDVKRGEVLGIIGKNGAGKSTLLKILSRVTAPTLGSVKIRGRVASLLEVGTGFHPELTGRENIFLNGAILGMTRAETASKFDEIVAFSGCERFIDTPVKRYSSGMYVRLAFAVAAHLEPEILVVDEVLAVGDAEFQKKSLGKMDEIAQGGRTVLFVSHSMPSIERLCSSCILLDGGTIACTGATRDVTAHYLDTTIGVADACDFARRASDLANRVLIMTGVRVFAEGTRPSDGTIVRVGDDVVFELSYRASREVTDITFFICLHDVRDGSLALHVNTRMTYGAIREVRGTGVVRCRVPKFALPPGDYRLDTGILSGRDFMDREERAMIVGVAPGDFFGTGYSAFAGAGRALFPHQWELE